MHTLTLSDPGTPGYGIAGLQGHTTVHKQSPSWVNDDVSAEVAYGSDLSGTLNLYFQVYRSGQSFLEGLAYHTFASNIPLGETHRLFPGLRPGDEGLHLRVRREHLDFRPQSHWPRWET